MKIFSYKNAEVLLPILSFYIDETEAPDLIKAIEKLEKDLADFKKHIKK